MTYFNENWEEVTIDESKKKKKKASSYLPGTIKTTGEKVAPGMWMFADPVKSIDAFNKRNDTSISAEDTDIAQTTATDAQTASTEGAGLSEDINLDEDKIFAKKMMDYVELPDFIQLLPRQQVISALNKLAPEEEFTLGYVTPLYFYKKLWDKFTLLQCTEFVGYTGVDYRYSDTAISKEERIKKATDQIAGTFTGRYDSSRYTVLNKAVDRNLFSNKDGRIDRLYDLLVKIANRKGISLEGLSKQRTFIDDVPYEFVVENFSKAFADYVYGFAEDNTYFATDVDETNDKDPEKTSKEDEFESYYRGLFYKLIRLLCKNPQYRDVKDLDTIAFYPTIGSQPRVTYYADLHNGRGYVKVSAAQLKATILNRIQAEGTEYDGYADPMTRKLTNTVQAAYHATEPITLRDGTTMPPYRSLYTTQIYYIKTPYEMLGKSLNESVADRNKLHLKEATRYIKRYYIRPQNVFCSNKEDILRVLSKYNDQNCSVYSLKNLDDHDDIHKLTKNDIIYYYDKGVLYDKNRVQVLDYDLFVKHEENRRKISDINTAKQSTLDKEYSDRITDITTDGQKTDAELNRAAKTEELRFVTEDLDTSTIGEKCCICGEPIDDEGHNPAPFMDSVEGKCCEACYNKFVLPMKESREEAKDAD